MRSRYCLPGLLLLAILVLPGGLFAQQFENIPALHFTRPYGGIDPLPQVLPVASTAANFAYTVAASTSSGGSWLSASPGGNCCVTPRGVSVIVNTGVNGAAMAAGTYSGQLTFTAGGVTTLTVSVTFVIAAPNTDFFDNTPGQVSFSMKLNGHPPAQVLQIRDAGAGSLPWTLTTSTFNNANWLSVSINSGTAPSLITVSILPQNLPGGGATAGTYSGQLLFQSGASSTVTVPVGITVSANAMDQVNALSFNKPHNGADPLSQIFTIASPGAIFAITVGASSATGSLSGPWLSLSPTGNCCDSPKSYSVIVTTSITLAAGTYTAQITVDNATQLMVIPVTLTVSLPTTPFFDNTAGQMSFFMQTNAAAPPPTQFLQIRSAGTGSLAWTLTATTFDSGNWLTVSDSADTAPNNISIGIVPANLPGFGITAGIFTANLLFQAQGASITVPITVQVGPNFEQINPIAFTMIQAGADPLPQNITVQITSGVAAFQVSSDTATGGNWLTVSPTGNCCDSPKTLEVSVVAPVTMAAGVYTGEIHILSATTTMTVPVTLTIVAPSSNPYFDTLPGEMSFFMQTPLQAGVPQQPSPQVFQIRNAGGGSLNWTLTALTADGGNWLTVSAPNGTAPALVTVSIVPANLPSGGLLAGVFVGQLLMQQGLTSVTIPVVLNIGTNVFEQVNGLNFTMMKSGANTLPQVITVNTTSASAAIVVQASTSTGGSWLTVAPTGNCCDTPKTFVVTVNPAVTLAAGIYTGQISAYSGTVSQTIPVTLTLAAPGTAFFDNVPGQLPYSLVTGPSAPNPPSQNVQIRNAGAGILGWTAQTFTSDGGNWLTLSSASGTAPSLVSVGVVTQNLQGGGLTAGLFTGQVLLISGNSTVTVPVSVRIGGTGIVQINSLNFTMPQAGANPLPQVLTTTSLNGAAIAAVFSAQTANGGAWMSVSPSGNCCDIPDPAMVTISAPVGLAAGTYTGQVIFDIGTSANVVPVSLTVAPPTVPFFDNLQGQMSFFAATNTTPASQSMLIEGLGAFGLNWSVTPITADTGNWLTLSATSGTTPATLTVGVNIANLPSNGLVAGQFTGQLLFQSASGSVTVPVSVQLGPNIFTQGTPLNFSIAYGAANPLTQSEAVTSSGTALSYSALAAAGNGGNWLTIAPANNCCATPQAEVYTVHSAPGTVPVPVPTGVHTGQAVYVGARSAMTVPVILTVGGLPIFSISKHHTGTFTAGQANATSTVTVSNTSTAGVGPTSGQVTVTESVPTGMTLQSMSGTGWDCSGGNNCKRSDVLGAGASYPAITVTVNVVTTTQEALTNSVSVSGGGALQAANTTDPTAIITQCNVDQTAIAVADVQTMINELLGLAPALNDLNGDGKITAADLQIVLNAVLYGTCQ
jgi:hypothetical protein